MTSLNNMISQVLGIIESDTSIPMNLLSGYLAIFTSIMYFDISIPV